MAEQNERMAVFSDEGGIFETLAGRYNKGVPNLDLWLKGHSVSPVRVDRADATRPPILLNRPHLTVGISPQPDVLEALRDKPGFRGRGLLARFLYALPRSPLGDRALEVHPVPSDVLDEYRAGIRELLELKLGAAIRLGLSRPAYSEWKEFQRAIEVDLRDGGRLDGLKDWGSKLPGACLRLAGIFHAVEIGKALADNLEISHNTVLRALDLGACLTSHARAVFDLMERDPNAEHAEKLVMWMIRENKPAFTVRDCFRAHQSRFKRVDALMPVLDLLEEHVCIRREPGESSGGRRPSDTCQVNPKILKGGKNRCAGAGVFAPLPV
jgi:putative DNA primase/helicase